MNCGKPTTGKKKSQMWKADPDGEAKGQLTEPVEAATSRDVHRFRRRKQK